jgi:hypothetical protein
MSGDRVIFRHSFCFWISIPGVVKMDRRVSLQSMASLALASMSALGGSARALAQNAAAQPTAATQLPSVMTMDINYLNHSRELIRKDDPSIFLPFNKLKSLVRGIMPLPPETVVNKTFMPPSGSKNDYLSLAPYWWPDPSKPDGLPFIQRDGQFNPDSKNEKSDSVRNQVMCMSCQLLSLMYHFTGEKSYAQKTADVLRTWFLNPATRMNPNLNFAQAIMGRVAGRGIGIIDTRNYWMVIDAVGLIQPANILSAQEVASLRKWFADYAKWMLESKNGRDEFNEFNNHGIFYEMQITNFALFSGDIERARESVERAFSLRMKSQITAKGEQWAELERNTPSHYVGFNLDAMANLARYSELLGGTSLWQRTGNNRSLRKALDWTLPYTTNKQPWPFAEIKDIAPTVKHYSYQVFLVPYLKAERAYGDGSFAAAVKSIPPEIDIDYQEWKDIATFTGDGGTPRVSNTVDHLIWPVMPKAAAPAKS